MPRIYLDVTRLVTRSIQRVLPTGVDRVGLAYVRHYGAQAQAVLSRRGYCVVLSPARSKRLFELLLQPTVSAPNELRKLILASIIASGHVTVEPGILLHTSHSGTEFERYYQWLGRRAVKVVAMLHDLIPLTHPEYCRPDVLRVQLARVKTVLARADGIIANSLATARSIESLALRLACTVPPFVTAALAPGIARHLEGESPLSMPYFVILSTIEPRKNHWMMLHVWRDLVDLYGDHAPVLVVIGRRGWECENVVDMLERCQPLQGRIIEEADCSDQRLQQYLHHARALLFPSFVEGYGMPLVEALQAGVPVIASDLPVFHEIAGEIPDYLDPLDGPGWRQRVLDYMAPDSSARAAQLTRLATFTAPTWDGHFVTVDRFLESLGDG